MTPGAESPAVGEVRALLDRWVEATIKRDPNAYSDLFLRDTDPVVVWPSGEVTQGWKSVFDHVTREFYHAKVVVQSVDIHDLRVVPLTDEAIDAAFQYDVHARDLWGTGVTAKRLATFSLVRTKDGLRIGSAHFGTPPAKPSA